MSIHNSTQNFPFLISLVAFNFNFFLYIVESQIQYFDLYTQQNPNKKIKHFLLQSIEISKKKGYKELFTLSHLFFECIYIAYSLTFISFLPPSSSFPFERLILIISILFFSNYFVAPFLAKKFLRTLTYLTFPLFSLYWFVFQWLGKIFYSCKYFNLNIDTLQEKHPSFLVEEPLKFSKNHFLQKEDVIPNIIRLKSLKLKDILTSRADIIAIEITSSYHDIINILKHNNFTRLPVYEKNIDKIKGILQTKDLIQFKELPTNFSLKNIIHKPFFMPNSKEMIPLLENFKERRCHMTIVVDEYGGTEGIVTLDDIFKKIIGEIYDEGDIPKHSMKKIKNNQYLIDPILTIDEINHFFGTTIPIHDQVESHTLSGFILFLAEKIPKEKEIFSFQNIQFQIIKMQQQSIEEVLLTIF